MFELLGVLRKTVNEALNECIVENPSTTSIDLHRMKERERALSKITDLHAGINTFAREVEALLQTCRTQYESDIALMGSFLKSKHVVNETWSGPSKRFMSKTIMSPPVTIPTSITTPPEYSKVSIVDSYNLMAIRVSEFSEIKTNGDLYYVESADHFAFKIANVLFHGNIGNIYTSENDPTRVKNCKFRGNCTNKECMYYHDPLHNPGSRDVRNFISNSWQYISPGCQYKNRTRSRRFGSREYIEADLPTITPEEVDRFYDQTVHDLLCSLMLNRYHHV